MFSSFEKMYNRTIIEEIKEDNYPSQHDHITKFQIYFRLSWGFFKLLFQTLFLNYLDLN